MARGSHGKKIDFTDWSGFTNAFSALAIASSTSSVMRTFSSSQTLMRTRGELLCYVDGTTVPGSSSQIAVGFLVQQTGATATSIPITDSQAPYFYYETFVIGYEEMVTDVIAAQGAIVIRKTIDSKAMRKVRADQEIAAVVQSSTIVGAGVTVNLSVVGRFLVGS